MLLLGLEEIREGTLEISTFFSFVDLLEDNLLRAMLLVHILLNCKNMLCLKVLFLLTASLI